MAKNGGCLGVVSGVFKLGCLIVGVVIAVPLIIGLMVAPSNVRQPASTQPAAPPPISTGPIIPGLQQVDVYLNLTKQGFKRTGPHSVEGTVFNNCDLTRDGVVYHVESYGPDSSRVRFIRATVMRPAEQGEATLPVSAAFLGMLGSLPFEGSDPIANRKWVESHVDGGSETLGGIPFKIRAISPWLTSLEIGYPQ